MKDNITKACLISLTCLFILACNNERKDDIKEVTTSDIRPDSIQQQEVLDSIKIKLDDIKEDIQNVSAAKTISLFDLLVPDSLVTPPNVTLKNIVWYKLLAGINGRGSLTMVFDDGSRTTEPITNPSIITAVAAVLSKEYKAYDPRNKQIHGNDKKAF